MSLNRTSPFRGVLYRRAERMRRIGFLALVCGALGYSPQAHGAAGDPVTLSLDYQVDDAVLGCPTPDEFRRRISDQVHYDPFGAEADLDLAVKVYRSATGLEADLVWKRKDGSVAGERRLSSADDCIELARGMSFAVAVQIQLLSDTSAEATPRQPNTAPVSPQVPKAKVLPTRDELDHSLHPSLAIGVGPSAALGTAPSLSTGGRAFARLALPRVDVELAAEAELPVSYQTASGGGFSLKSFDATLAPCLLAGRMRACGVVAVGRSAVAGFGVETVRRDTSTVVRAGARLGFDHRLTSVLSFGAHADGLLLLSPVTVYLRTAPVWAMPTVALKVGLDLALVFQ